MNCEFKESTRKVKHAEKLARDTNREIQDALRKFGESKRLTRIRKRSCGDCTECCTSMAVNEIDKPSGESCAHARCDGCAIYPNRPYSCAAWSCLWLSGYGPDSAKPSASGFMAYFSYQTDNVIVAHIVSATPYESEPALDMIEEIDIGLQKRYGQNTRVFVMAEDNSAEKYPFTSDPRLVVSMIRNHAIEGRADQLIGQTKSSICLASNISYKEARRGGISQHSPSPAGTR